MVVSRRPTNVIRIKGQYGGSWCNSTRNAVYNFEEKNLTTKWCTWCNESFVAEYSINRLLLIQGAPERVPLLGKLRKPKQRTYIMPFKNMQLICFKKYYIQMTASIVDALFVLWSWVLWLISCAYVSTSEVIVFWGLLNFEGDVGIPWTWNSRVERQLWRTWWPFNITIQRSESHLCNIIKQFA